MRHTVQELFFSDDFRITIESFFPKPIADHDYRVAIAAIVFFRTKSAPKNWMDTQGVEIVRGDNTVRYPLSAIADVQGCTAETVHDEPIEELAITAKILHIGPRNSNIAPAIPVLVNSTVVNVEPKTNILFLLTNN